MTSWLGWLFRCPKRQSMAEAMMEEQDRKHEEMMREMNIQVRQAQRAAVESKSAARTLLKRLSEDIPR